MNNNLEPTLYAKDKRYRVTVRLNETLWEFVKESADSLGVSPSEYIRMGIHLGMNATKQALKEKVGNGRENDSTDDRDIV